MRSRAWGILCGRTSQFFSNLYLNELDRFVKHKLKVPHYIRYVDDFVLLDSNPSRLHRLKLVIGEFLKDKLKLSLHPRKTVIQPIHRGCDFIGYIVRPHCLTVRPRTVKALLRRLAFFNHLLNPKDFPHFDPPPHNPWAHQVQRGLLVPPIVPSLGLLQHMLQVVNSYYGTMAHADSYKLRRQIYLNHFHRLQDYFIAGNSFDKMLLRPVELLKKEGIIAI